jgi:hypothetical protein
MPPDRPASAPEVAPPPRGLVTTLQRVPPSVYGGLVMAAIGALGWACTVPWLFPSLGPTIAIQSEAPEHHSARPWSVVVGHLIGAAVGFAAVRLTGVIHHPPVNVSHVLTGARVLAAALAVFASMALQTLARARHAPAQATTLLIVVGALDADLHGALVLLGGIALVATLGEGVRRIKLAR